MGDSCYVWHLLVGRAFFGEMLHGLFCLLVVLSFYRAGGLLLHSIDACRHNDARAGTHKEVSEVRTSSSRTIHSGQERLLCCLRGADDVALGLSACNNAHRHAGAQAHFDLVHRGCGGC